jgi:hypothetical protein
MARLEAAHLQLLRDIHRRYPTPYDDVFRRDEVCNRLEDVGLLQDLATEGLVWFKGYGGKFGTVGIWTITRAGAERVGRLPAARAPKTAPDSAEESGTATARQGGKR